MSARIAIKALADITADQWGLVTTQQAENAGVGRLQLSRLANAGLFRRVRQGVYFDAGAPEDRLTNLRAHWLALKPGVLAFERVREPHLGAVVATTSAAWVYQAGSFMPAPYVFHVPERIQNSSKIVKLRMRRYKTEQIEIHNGLPITSPTQTVIDLLRFDSALDAAFEVAVDLGQSQVDLAAILQQSAALARALRLPTKQLRLALEQLGEELNPIAKTLREVSESSQKLLSEMSSLRLDSAIEQQITAIREGVETIQQQLESSASLQSQKENH